MKKLTISILSVVLVAAVLFTGCQSLSKMKDSANLITVKPTPNPLEMHAEQVGLKISLTFPAKYFPAKAILVATPVLKAEDGSIEKIFEPVTIQGEKVKDNNIYKVPYKTGGTISWQDTIPYVDGLRASDLYISLKATMGGKSADLISIKCGDGVVTTPRLVEEGMAVDNNQSENSTNKFGKTMTSSTTLETVISETKESVVYFDLQQANIKPKEQTKEEMKKWLADVQTVLADKDKNVKGVSISSYASPDGPETLNQSLVGNRGKSSQDFINKQLQDALNKKIKEAKKDEAAKTAYTNQLNAVKNTNFMVKETTPSEDWDGFKKEIEKSEMKDKDLVVRVLQMYSDPVVREKEIKKMSKVYDDLRKVVLPQLRRSVLKINFEGKQKTDAEIISLATSNPSSLKQNELFYAATKAEAAKQVEIYKTYTTQFPNDWKGYNNLGATLINNNNFADAETALNKANSLEANNAMVINNLGVLYYAKKDYKKAEEFFNKAKNINNAPEIGYNLGVINIKQAKYKEAVTNFGATPSFNKALAQLLNGETGAAQNTVKAMGDKNYAIFYYLKAIVAMRNNQEDEAINNLKTAVSKNANLKKYAKEDAEFLKFVQNNNETFKQIVQ